MKKEDKIPGFNIDTFAALTRLVRRHKEDLDHLERFREYLEGYFTREELDAEGLAPVVVCAYGGPFMGGPDEPLRDEDYHWDVCLEHFIIKYAVPHAEALDLQEKFQSIGARVSLSRST